MSDDKPTPSLNDLDAKLREVRARHAEEPKNSGRQAIGPGLGFALRIGVELVAALAVGVGIGLLLDYWLETKPWLMVVFFFLGSAAGFLNVYRMVSGYGYAAGYRKEDDETKSTSPQSGDEGSK
jgi:ATP synthase protein I